MRVKLLLIIAILLSVTAGAQYVQPMNFTHYGFPYNVNIGAGKLKITNPSAFLELGDSIFSKKGFLPARGWKDSIVNPVKGEYMHDIPSNAPWYFDGSAWQKFSSTVPYVDSVWRASDIIYWKKSGVTYNLGTYATVDSLNTKLSIRDTANKWQQKGNYLLSLGITPATHTIITYNAAGQVTGGSDATTDNIPEGATNLYSTTARIRAALSSTSPITFSGGVIGLNTVPISKGGTALTTVGANGTYLKSNGTTLYYATDSMLHASDTVFLMQKKDSLHFNSPLIYRVGNEVNIDPDIARYNASKFQDIEVTFDALADKDAIVYSAILGRFINMPLGDFLTTTAADALYAKIDFSNVDPATGIAALGLNHTLTGGYGITIPGGFNLMGNKTAILDTATVLSGYVNAITLNTPNVLYTTPINFSVSNHLATGSLTLNTQTAYKVFGTGSSTATPSFQSALDSNYMASGFHTEAYFNNKYYRPADTAATVSTKANATRLYDLLNAAKLNYSDSTIYLTKAAYKKGQDSAGTVYVPNTRTVNGKALSSNITLSLASADFANQGTTTTVLHGNAGGNTSFGPIVNADITNATIDLTTKVTGVLPAANVANLPESQITNLTTDLAALATTASISRKIAYTTVVGTDANITAAAGTAYSLPAATLSANRTIDVSALTTNDDYLEIDNQEAGFTWSFTGATVYDAYENSVTTLLTNTRYLLRRTNGKIKIIN